MSRPIKFRAWDKEAKEYCYNAEHTYDFLCSGKGCCSESFGTVLDDERFIVEQYTGLKDKNGKEIYERDIVKFEDSSFVIGWNIKFARFGFEPIGDGSMSSLVSGLSMRKCEVLGNIHENQGLLGGEE